MVGIFEKMLPLLSGRTILVTGGARGIGRDISRVLARHGANVAVNYSASGEKALKTVAEIEAEGGKAIAVGGDVRVMADFERMVNETKDHFGSFFGVVNNAIAGRQSGGFFDLSDEDFHNMVNFGCIAVANSVRATTPAISEHGAIVNIVTEIWNMGPADWSAYMAGKGAMVGMSRSLANELGPRGITVNMVAPGWMADEKVDTSSSGSQGFASGLPLRFHGSGEEIGNACVFFLSDLGKYVTGAYLPVTGGRITQMGS
jgi:3-oxoacyl-[acyl-carrier protein] reductase